MVNLSSILRIFTHLKFLSSKFVLAENPPIIIFADSVSLNMTYDVTLILCENFDTAMAQQHIHVLNNRGSCKFIN